MAKYNIPEHVKEGFSILIKSSRDKIESLINELSNAPKGLSPLELSDYLFKKDVYSKNEAKEIVAVLTSLYRLKERENRSINEIAEDICIALKETSNDKLKPKAEFEKVIIQLLSLKIIGATLKALSLQTEYYNTFCNARIITDVRPVFDDDIDKQIETGIIVHNLKIDYHKGGVEDHKEFFVALDNNDLKKLKEQIIRAEKKEKSIKSSLKNIFSFIQ